MTQINMETIEGRTYYTTTARGVRYTLNYEETGRVWGLRSQRISLGRLNVGTFRYFDTLEDLEKTIKAFRGVACLLTSSQMVEA